MLRCPWPPGCLRQFPCRQCRHPNRFHTNSFLLISSIGAGLGLRVGERELFRMNNVAVVSQVDRDPRDAATGAAVAIWGRPPGEG